MRQRTSRIVTVAAGLAARRRARRGPGAQGPRRADAEYLRTAYDTYRSMARSSPYAGVPWQYLGPTNISGRATDIAVADRGTSRRIYAGYATSGVWQTDDHGVTWTSIFDDYASTSIGDLAVAPSNPDVLWVGTGEANIFRASMPGVGIYKSTDAGRTFAHMGLSDTQTIARVIVHPANADTVFVAASGHEWTDNEERGVFKTTDGGRTWKKVFYRSPRTGAIDLVMDPANPNTLYASMWQRVRRKWSDPRVEPGYNEGGIWKTTDGGNSWTEINTGLPAAPFRGRIGIDVSRSNPSVLYAFVDNYEPGRPPRDGERDAYARPIQEARIKAAEVYRTDDKGATWRKVSESNDFMSGHSGTYGWVFGQIRVDPKDENDHLHHGPLAERVARRRQDLHDPSRHARRPPRPLDRPRELVGALQRERRRHLPLGRCGRHVEVRRLGRRRAVLQRHARRQQPGVGLRLHPGHRQPPRQGRRQRRARQDSGGGMDRARPAEKARTRPSITRTRTSSTRTASTETSRATTSASRRRRAAAAPARPTRAAAARDRREAAAVRSAARASVPRTRTSARSGWRRFSSRRTTRAPSTPASSTSSARLDRGATWEKISADLTDNDPARMLRRSSSEIPYQTVSALAESPRKRGVLYAGTDDGRLHVTVDDGKQWTELTAGLRIRKWISRVVPSAARGRDGLHHPARPRRRRLRALHLQVGRLRQNADEHRQQHPGGPGQRDPRGSDRPEHPLRRDRLRRVRLRGRRPPVARAGREPAVGPGVGPAVSAARPRHRHLDVRPRDVGDGCHEAARPAVTSRSNRTNSQRKTNSQRSGLSG